MASENNIQFRVHFEDDNSTNINIEPEISYVDLYMNNGFNTRAIFEMLLSSSLSGTRNLSNNIYQNILNNSLNELSSLQKDENVVLDISREKYKDISSVHGECSICYESFVEEDVVTVLDKCKHVFHVKCLENWGKYKQECPICRSNIPKIENQEEN